MSETTESYYLFRQHPSGGQFVPPAINVVVRARSFTAANKYAEYAGIYFGEPGSEKSDEHDCLCDDCGNRWEPLDFEDGNPTVDDCFFIRPAEGRGYQDGARSLWRKGKEVIVPHCLVWESPDSLPEEIYLRCPDFQRGKL